MTRNGKIARLPKPLRDQLNHRLENGEQGAALVKWLNSLPEVQALIKQQFGGHAIREQNLSEWKKGGYLEWLAQQERLAMVRQFQEEAEELAEGTTPTDLNRQLSVILMAELAQAMCDIKQIADPLERADAMGKLVNKFAQLRREESSAHRSELACAKWRRQVQKEENDHSFADQRPVTQAAALYQQMLRSALKTEAELERQSRESQKHRSLTDIYEESQDDDADSPTESDSIPPDPTKSDQPPPTPIESPTAVDEISANATDVNAVPEKK